MATSGSTFSQALIAYFLALLGRETAQGSFEVRSHQLSTCCFNLSDRAVFTRDEHYLQKDDKALRLSLEVLLHAVPFPWEDTAN